MTDSNDQYRERLEQAEMELRQAKREGAAREPMLRRLERHRDENRFGERLRALLDATYRGRA